MKLTWRQKDFESDIDFIMFHQKHGGKANYHR